jgi:glutamate-ammonia-ligase adenylyltransferase
MVRLSLEWIWQGWWATGDKRAHQAQADLVVLAYGKLGGKELGYGSDLDLVFIHGDANERAQECYAALAKKLINWFTTKTALGDLYEIDTALRPNGNAGLLVTRIDAFEQYQNQRGSNAAWTWEHQAITRARVVCGPTPLSERVDATRAAVLQSPRKADALRAEIVAMRQRMRDAHPCALPNFDLKHSEGAMIDVEFAVQTLVLLHARQDAGLLANVGNIALLQYAEAAGFLPDGVGHAAADAYRDFRKQQHARRLNEESLVVAAADWVVQCGAVKALWSALGLRSDRF